MNLKFDSIKAFKENEKNHPQVVMKELGITYEESIPKPLGDCWWFINCKNVPEKLPKYLKRI